MPRVGRHTSGRDGSAAAPEPIHYVVLVGAQLAVGSAALLARAGLAGGLGPLALSAWRLALAALVVTAAARAAGRVPRAQGPPPARRGTAALLAAGACLAVHFVAWFASLERIPVARSTLLVCTSPLWAGLGGLLVRARPLPRLFWPGLALAGAGLWLVTGAGPGPRAPLGGQVALGDTLAAVAAVCFAGYLLLVERPQERLGTARVVATTYSAAALLLLPAAVALGGPAALPRTEKAWMSVVGMALVPQLLGHTALNWSLRRFAPGVVAAATLLEPVFAGALAWWLLGEAVTGRQAAGACVLLAGVALAVWQGEGEPAGP